MNTQWAPRQLDSFLGLTEAVPATARAEGRADHLRAVPPRRGGRHHRGAHVAAQIVATVDSWARQCQRQPQREQDALCHRPGHHHPHVPGVDLDLQT